MKTTNISWIPSIPDNWNVVRLKDIAKLQSGESITSDNIDAIGEYPVFGGNGLRGYTDAYTNEGDYVLIGRQGALCGNINYAKGKFFASEHAVVVYTYDKNENTTWLGETLRAANFNRLSASAAQPGLAVGVLNFQKIPFPPKDVRKKIGIYLDEKLSAINKRVSVLEKEMDAYARLKKSIIHQAVTRGLDSEASLKNSGIDWIGMTPKHWEVKRIKDVSSVNVLTLPENTEDTYQFKYIDISNVSSTGRITFGEEIAFYEAPSRARRIIKKRDIIVSTVRTYLRAIAFIDFEPTNVIVSTGFAVLTPNNDIEAKYLAYILRDCSTVNAICSQSTGVSYPAISASKLASINLIIPSLPEQQTIIAYLDEKCAKIDAAIENIGKQVDASKRLKKAIINEAISGKAPI